MTETVKKEETKFQRKNFRLVLILSEHFQQELSKFPNAMYSE